MENEEIMLTTYDNPFNPFENFDAWWKEDIRLGHDCCGTLAKVASLNTIASDSVNDEEVSRAINEIVEAEPLIYRKISKNQSKVSSFLASTTTLGA